METTEAVETRVCVSCEQSLPIDRFTELLLPVSRLSDGIELAKGPHAVVAARHDFERNPPFGLAHP